MGGRINKLILMHVPSLLTSLRIWKDKTEILGGGGPSAWALTLFSQYPFDPCAPSAERLEHSNNSGCRGAALTLVSPSRPSR